MRFTAAIPVVFSVPAFAVLLFLAIAGTGPNANPDYYALHVNTSKVGNNIVTFSAANTTSTTTSAAATATATGGGFLSSIGLRDTENDKSTTTGDPQSDIGLHARQTPNITSPEGILNGLAGLLGLSGPSNTNTTEGGLSVTSIIGQVVSDIVSGHGLSETLTDLEDTLLEDLRESYGVQDAYRLYMRNVCSGAYMNGTKDGSTNLTTCSWYSSAPEGLSNATSGIPSSFTVLSTNISVPLLASSGSLLPTVGTLISTITGANFAFLVIAIVSSGITALGSLVGIFLTADWFVLALMIISLQAPLMLLINALVITITGPVLASVINGLEDSLSLTATSGGKSVAIAWSAAALTTVSALYWFMVWFVSTRGWVLVRVKRDSKEYGNVVATLRGTYRNLGKINDPADLRGGLQTKYKINI